MYAGTTKGTIRLKSVVAIAAVTVLAAACGVHDVNTTNPKTYTQGYKPSPTPSRTFKTKDGATKVVPVVLNIDQQVARAANVKPLLRFPARIGIVRIEGGAVKPVPPKQADAWLGAARRLGPRFGTFVPLSPLVMEIATGEIPDTAFGAAYRSPRARLIRRIRLGAARQHLQAVLIYEVHSKAKGKDGKIVVPTGSILESVFVPSATLNSSAVATAVLLDVRNGYSYGTALGSSRTSAQVSRSAGALSRQTRAAVRSDQVKAVADLATNVEMMGAKLRAALTRSVAQR